MTSWIASQFRTFRRMYRWWRDQLTTMGKVVFLVMLCTLPTFADSAAALAIAFMGSSVMLLVTSAASYLYRPKLVVQAICPRHWIQRQTRVVQLELRNRSRLPVYDMEVQIQPEAGLWEVVDAPPRIPVLVARATMTLPVTLRPLRRGLQRLPCLQATTCFPLQLVRRSEQVRIGRQALILPFYHPLRNCHLAENIPHDARGQVLAMQSVGLTGEYVGSREYQPGIPVRKWDYASWARLGQPVVREFSEPRHPCVALIVDTSLAPEQSGQADPVRELEAVISLAAALSEVIIAHGNRIELLVLGNQVLTNDDDMLAAGHLAILEHLALAEPCTLDAIGSVARQLEHVPAAWDTVIYLSQHWHAAQRQLLQQATAGHIHASIVLVASIAGQPRGDWRGGKL